MKISSETINAVLGAKIFDAEIWYKALKEFLIGKEIISEHAIIEKYKSAMDRDGKKLYNDIFKQFAYIEEIRDSNKSW